MSKTPETVKNLPDSDIEIIGQGEVGEKVRQLKEKTPLLRSLGFNTPKRIVLAEDFFDNFFQTNQLGSNLRAVTAGQEAERAVENGSFTDDQNSVINRIIRDLGKQPLVVRSSALADARGTGTYRSEFVQNTPSALKNGIRHVLASYFTPSAIAFRRDANAGEGFGIIIEPLIGHKLNGHNVAPILSGYGYTSTSRSDGYIVMVPGLGGGVETRDGERIMKSDIEEYNFQLEEYFSHVRDEMVFGYKLPRKSTLLRMTHRHIFGGYEGQAFYSPEGRVANTTLFFEGPFERTLNTLNLKTFYEKMAKLEGSIGRPQYFEWAMTYENGRPKYWVLQIADISKRLDVFDFGDEGETLFTGHTVTGSGIKDCTKIVQCWNATEINALNRFNQVNHNYILVFSSRLTTLALGQRKLKYDDFSNASVFLEIQDAPHTDNNPVSHLGGQLDVTGKFFGVLDYDAVIPPNWDMFREGKRSEEGIDVYEGKIKVIASERQNRMAFYIQE